MACVVAGISRIKRGQGCSGMRVYGRRRRAELHSASMIRGHAVQLLDANWCHILRAVGVRQCLASVQAGRKRTPPVQQWHMAGRGACPGVVISSEQPLARRQPQSGCGATAAAVTWQLCALPVPIGRCRPN